MRIDRWIVASLVLLIVLATGCKPKVGGKCTLGQSFCTKDGALFCGEDNKLVATSCQGAKGCVQTGRVASCDQSLAVAGEPCEDIDNVACSVDKKSELDCKDHSWVVGATCKGAKGCELKGDELFCDHTLADKDDPCHRDGQIACTMDKAFILKCTGKVMKAIDSCRGPKSCVFEEQPAQQRIEFSCDDSVAEAGDPCESENNHACSVDKKAIHVCRGHAFVTLKQCPGPKGCTFDPATDKLSCDTGSGVFVGGGGSAKVSSSAGAAGGTAKGKSGTAATSSASAKPTASAPIAAASGSAKPVASAAGSAPPAGSGSAKPAGSTAASAAGSAKPVPSAKALGKKKP
jgi:hypothetical protein